MVTRVGSTTTMQLWELIEKHKLIASEQAGQAGRALKDSPSERIRQMLHVAAGESDGAIELPPVQNRGWKKGVLKPPGGAEDDSEEDEEVLPSAKKAKGASASSRSPRPNVASPKPKAKRRAGAKARPDPGVEEEAGAKIVPDHSENASQARRKPPASNNVKAEPGRPRTDFVGQLSALLERFSASGPSDLHLWGAESGTQRKELKDLEKRLLDRSNNLKDEDKGAVLMAHKTCRLLTQSVQMGMDFPSLDSEGFRQAFDQVETERLLPPAIEVFSWPLHLQRARQTLDL